MLCVAHVLVHSARDGLGSDPHLPAVDGSHSQSNLSGRERRGIRWHGTAVNALLTHYRYVLLLHGRSLVSRRT